LDQCQILYIAYKVSASRRAVLAKLKGRPVLTVSNARGFLREGGIIRFDVADYVKINVNLDQARAVELAIQTKMLEVSNDIIENGKLRKVR
jgi:stage V sporulation protein SpoVS